MMHLSQKLSQSKWEIPFQFSLHILVFLIYALNANHKRGIPPTIEFFEVVFFLNYAVAAFIINYVLFKHFLYKNKIWQFGISITVLITIVIFIEELVLEPIYFPDYRGKHIGLAVYNLADVMPVILILSGIKLGWDIMRKEMLVQELKATMEENELKFLKSQINPHFLFNNLNNLYAHALENSPKTPDIILEMSSVLRYMLYECNNQYVDLSHEITELKNFIRLYEMQIEGRGKVKVETNDLENSKLKIAPLILMIFVENAFKHSAVNLEDNIGIEISISLKEEELTFEVVNNIEPNQVKESEGGIGLENVRKRLQYLYPDMHSLKITSTENQFSVHLEMTLTYN